ncbi:MAG TPA: efflux RND transporter periplasmic adaptor subunit [Steroidobacteraceae bacterium]
MSIGSNRLSRTRLLMAAGGVTTLALIAWMLAPARPSAAAPKGEDSQAVAIDAAAATRRDVPVYLEGLGNVQAFYTVKLTARVDGELIKVAFIEGQKVKRGQLLAQIDPRPYQAALDQALATRAKDNAQLANARKDLARYVMLAPKKLASQQTLDGQRALVAQLEAQLAGDKAAIESAQTQLSYTRITSPIDGRTGIRLVDPGNIVHASDTTGIVVITQTQPIAAVVTLPENALGAVAQAMSQGPVSISVLPRKESQGAPAASIGQSAAPERGAVQLIDNQIDPTSGTVRLKAIFPNASERLWPGEFINARVLVRTERHALTVPSVALQRGDGGFYAYVIGSDSRVEARPVEVGYNDEEIAIVEKGLNEGERVATSNFYRLQPGALVHVNEPEREAGREALAVEHEPPAARRSASGQQHAAARSAT